MAGSGVGCHKPEEPDRLQSDPESTPAPAPVVPNRSAADVTRDVKAFITRSVAESSKPVALSSLASKALKEGDGLGAATWAGYSGFKKLVEALPLLKLNVDWETGTVIDHARHTAGAQLPEAKANEVALDAVPAEVTRLIKSELEQAGRPVSCARLAKSIVDRHSSLAADWVRAHSGGFWKRWIWVTWR